MMCVPSDVCVIRDIYVDRLLETRGHTHSFALSISTDTLIEIVYLEPYFNSRIISGAVVSTVNVENSATSEFGSVVPFPSNNVD